MTPISALQKNERDKHPRQEGQRGMALVVVLWMITLLSLLILSFTLSVRTNIALGSNENLIVKKRAAILAGVELAAAKLLEKDPELLWPADGSVHKLEFADFSMDIRVIDENTRVDLNKAKPELLEALLRQFTDTPEEALSLVDAIIDWRDKDKDRRLQGAEDKDYRAKGYEFGAGDTPFVSVDQLRHVLNLPYNIHKHLLSSTTVYSLDGRINIKTAARKNLLAIPGINEQNIEDVMRISRQEKFKLSDLKNLVSQPAKFLTLSPGPAYTVLINLTHKGKPATHASKIAIMLKADREAPYRLANKTIIKRSMVSPQPLSGSSSR